MINREALFADETELYRYPMNIYAGDTVTLRFRTEKDDAESVVFFSRASRKALEKTESDEFFDYYETKITVNAERIYYEFEISSGFDRCFYNKMGVTENPQLQMEYAFGIVPGFVTPDWAKGAVMYQIFTDRYRNGNPDNDTLSREYIYTGKPVEKVDDWNKPVESYDVHRFYGGDLQGVLDKLDYLKNLGIEVLYFNPLFVSPSNHKYDVQDYDYIDPHFTVIEDDDRKVLQDSENQNAKAEGYIKRVTSLRNLCASNDFFAHFTEEVHKRGMRLILDGVFNHCGSFNKWMDRELIYSGRPEFKDGAFISGESPYRDYFMFEDSSGWPHNPSYIDWWGNVTLPKLNYENSKELKNYIMGIAKKWIAPPFKVDGWRLDVAADLGKTGSYNHEFWREFRKTVKEENPEALILAEHYGNPEHWLRGQEWDSVMNYDAFMEPVSWFLTGMEKHSDEYRPNLHGDGAFFFNSLLKNLCHMPVQSIFTAMNELSNHDHSRFLTRTNGRTGRLKTSGEAAASEGISYAVLKEAVVMQFSLPGAPTVYYGDETGMTGWTDPDSRRPYPWGKENWELIAFNKDIIKIYKSVSCFRTGSFLPLGTGRDYIAYGRFDGKSAAIICINNSYSEICARINAYLLECGREAVFVRKIRTSETGYNVGTSRITLCEGVFIDTLPAKSATVYTWESN